MENKSLLNDILLIKDINIKTLVSGDKQARIVLETLYPNTIDEINNLTSKQEVRVVILDEVLTQQQKQQESEDTWIDP